MLRANRLARHLRKLGVRAGYASGAVCERSLEMVVGLLAILKAGGAYVPLDPAYPIERLAYMLEDSAPVAALTHAQVQARVSLRSTLAEEAGRAGDRFAGGRRRTGKANWRNPDRASVGWRRSIWPM